MSKAKLAIAAVVVVGGIIATKWFSGREQSKAVKRTTSKLVDQHPDLVVKIYANRIKRRRAEGASELEIAELEMAMYKAQERLDQDRVDALDVIVEESAARTAQATQELEAFRIKADQGIAAARAEEAAAAAAATTTSISK